MAGKRNLALHALLSADQLQNVERRRLYIWCQPFLRDNDTLCLPAGMFSMTRLLPTMLP